MYNLCDPINFLYDLNLLELSLCSLQLKDSFLWESSIGATLSEAQGLFLTSSLEITPGMAWQPWLML